MPSINARRTPPTTAAAITLALFNSTKRFAKMQKYENMESMNKRKKNHGKSCKSTDTEDYPTFWLIWTNIVVAYWLDNGYQFSFSDCSVN